jgi:hypothetical protein
MEQSKREKNFEFIENITFLILRVILFACLLIYVFANADKWWELGLTLGVLAVVVMFRRLDFLEIVNIVKAGTKYYFQNEASTAYSHTPDETSKQLKKETKERTLQSDYPKEEALPENIPNQNNL